MSVYQSVNDREQSGYQSTNSNVEDVVKRDTVKLVAGRLGRSESTIRRYTTALEKEGRSFIRQGKTRMYSVEDEELLSKMIQCTEELELSVEMAARTVLDENQSLTEKLKEVKETHQSNELAVRDFGQKLDEMFSILKDNFASKEDVQQLSSMFEMIIQQDQQKSQLIEVQNAAIERLSALVERSNKQTVQRDEVIKQLELSRKESEKEKQALASKAEEIIQEQNKMLLRMQEEREQDRIAYKEVLEAKDEENLKLQNRLKQTLDIYDETKGTVNWQSEKLEEIGSRLNETNDKLEEMKKKKRGLASLFSRNK